MVGWWTVGYPEVIAANTSSTGKTYLEPDYSYAGRRKNLDLLQKLAMAGIVRARFPGRIGTFGTVFAGLAQNERENSPLQTVWHRGDVVGTMRRHCWR